MSLMLWEPLRGARSMTDFDRMVEEFFGNRAETPVQDEWKPAADLVAEKDAYVFRFDLPGVAHDDIDIDVVDGVLTVQGKREDKTEEKSSEGKVFRRETFVGSFRRSFRLPDNIDAGAISANHNDGVLEVRVPKAAEAQPRRIQIASRG